MRVDFTGGFTDVAPFRNEKKAIHINATIDLYVRVKIKTRRDSIFAIYSPIEETPREFTSFRELSKDSRYKFITTALRTFSLIRGMDIIIITEAPMGVGLGSSGAFGVAFISACYLLRSQNKIISNHGEIAAIASDVENRAGLLGGRQDQFAAAYGGINRFEFFKNTWNVYQVSLNGNQIKKLESCLIIAHPGGRRMSSDIVSSVFSRYSQDSRRTYNVLESLNNFAFDIESALKDFNLQNLAKSFENVRLLQKRLHPGIVNNSHRLLIKELTNVPGVGSKMLGGGGSGACILIICPINGTKAVVSKILKARKYNIIPTRITRIGLRSKINS